MKESLKEFEATVVRGKYKQRALLNEIYNFKYILQTYALDKN